MKEFFHSWVFKVLLALAVIMFAFMLRATVTMGASTVLERIVGTITAPFQSLSAGVSGSVTGFLDQFLRASEISEENERLREENRQLIEQMVDYENYKHENESLKEQLKKAFKKGTVIPGQPTNKTGRAPRVGDDDRFGHWTRPGRPVLFLHHR